MTSIYDHPLYYDILFGWDRSAEARFYHEAFLRHGVPPEGRVLEVCCGTGQIALRLARRGWRMTGLARSPAMLAFLAAQAAQGGVALTPLCADMTSFVLPERQHAACNPLSSFRLLLDEDDARSHLRCVAAALESGGVYILDTAFGTSGEAEDDLEEWVMERDDIEVHARPDRVEVRDGGRGLQLTLDWHEQMHPYTPASFQSLIASAGRLSVETCYPEAGQTEDGISLFDLQPARGLPAQGRAMVVLRHDA